VHHIFVLSFSVSRSRVLFVVYVGLSIDFGVCLVLIQFVLTPSPLPTRYCEYVDDRIKQANWFNIQHYRIVQNLCLRLQFYNQDQFNKVSTIVWRNKIFTLFGLINIVNLFNW